MASVVVDAAMLEPGGEAGEDGAEDGEPAERLAGAAGGDDGFSHHDEDANDGEDDFRQEREEVDGHLVAGLLRES